MARRGPAAAQANELFTEHVPVDDWFKVWLVEIAAQSASLLANYQSNLRLHTSPSSGICCPASRSWQGSGDFKLGMVGSARSRSTRRARSRPALSCGRMVLNSMRKCSAC